MVTKKKQLEALLLNKQICDVCGLTDTKVTKAIHANSDNHNLGDIIFVCEFCFYAYPTGLNRNVTAHLTLRDSGDN